MDKQEDRLQKKLEQLQNGNPLEVCTSDLAQEEAELLSLVDQLSRIAYPQADEKNVATQRARLVRLAEAVGPHREAVESRRKELKMNTPSRFPTAKPSNRLPRWLVPATLTGAVVVTFACVMILVAGGLGGFLWWKWNNTDVSPAIAVNPTATATRIVRLSPTTVTQPVETPMPKPLSTGEPAPEPTVQVKALSWKEIVIPDTTTAALRDVRGLVQIQDENGDWQAVPVSGLLIQAGHRVRTGNLSSADLAFYDGSIATLGPNTETSIDELDAGAAGEARIVVLTQWTGETRHDVVSSDIAGSRYEVNTPSGTGTAKGTAFCVLITPLQVRFSVDEGAVAVTHIDVTVVVVAGQVTTIVPNEPPTEPFFQVRGQGQVSQTGATWTIAGQNFETHDGTIIVGNPQVGDWVWVEGHLLDDDTRVADRIVLLRRSVENRFEITGAVDGIGDDTWIVAGQTLSITNKTVIEQGIELQDTVVAQGHVLQEGTLVADQITLLEPAALSFEFVGVLQAKGSEVWTISNISVTVDAQTEFDPDLAIDDVVQVEGVIQENGAWLASEIKLVEQEQTFEFSGIVASIDPWIVSGVDFETDDLTEADPEIEPGDRVKVEGQIMEDGTWLAREIVLIEEGDDGQGTLIEFVGRITGIDPWSVNSIPLIVDDQTEIKGNARLGVHVRVKALLQPDGTLLARQIKAVGFARGHGCLDFSSIVAQVNDAQIILINGLVIPLDSLHVEGEIEPGSLIVLGVCVENDGSIVFVNIVLVYQLDPDVVVLPAPVLPPPQPAQPPSDGGEVTICHKPGTPAERTMTISRSALQSHLGHGDTIGPCK
ncbi:MAG: FecR domain-containing protein [Anaerolineae bacterium]|nr:FecR domain-containing protein [Anaerolineae bacterium]